MAKTSMNLEENIASLLCYIGIWLTGIIFFFLEKENKTVKFHAMQSILTFLPLTIIGWILIGPLGVSWGQGSVYGITYAAPTLSPFYYIGLIVYALMFILWLVLIIKAYQGEKFKLPIVGDIAEKQVK